MLIATAGHVDHGKTLLIKALTGVDTDRLPDEKARGLTIDLGFAYPGTGEAIDFALLIVAADDGPMPQTREHLAILDLMDIRAGAAVITKIDRCTPERIAEVETDVANLLAGTRLANAPLFKVCAMDGTGIPALRAHLDATAAQMPEPTTNGNFRLAVDRSFTVAGAGVVVTGAVFSGEVRIGDRLRVQPGNFAARVRSIHSPQKRCTAVSGWSPKLTANPRGESTSA
jgi:selenocysteine-specific elongation factor